MYTAVTTFTESAPPVPSPTQAERLNQVARPAPSWLQSQKLVGSSPTRSSENALSRPLTALAEWAALEALRVNRRLRDWPTLIDSVLERLKLLRRRTLPLESSPPAAPRPSSGAPAW